QNREQANARKTSNKSPALDDRSLRLSMTGCFAFHSGFWILTTDYLSSNSHFYIGGTEMSYLKINELQTKHPKLMTDH
ncbi:MAG: hypothetical protein ABIH24_02020, partial [Verrucomicrobiota bacterium]